MKHEGSRQIGGYTTSRTSGAKPAPKAHDRAENPADQFNRLIRQLNRALDDRHHPVDHTNVRALEHRIDRVVNTWK